MKTYRVKARVVFTDIISDALIIDASNDLMSLSTDKSWGRCSGSWQIIVPYKIALNKQRYDEILKPNDMVTIEITTGQSDYITVMIGLVDRVAISQSTGANGIPSRQIKITGRDMGKLLEEHDIGWDILNEKMALARPQDNELGPPVPTPYKNLSRLWNPIYQKGTAEEIAYNLMSLTFDKEITSSRFTSFTGNTDDQWIRHVPLFGSLSGRSLWAAMKEVEHAPYNMLNGDTVSSKMFAVVLEKQPFDDEGKINRSSDKTVVIDDTEIMHMDVGVSDNERINLLFFNPTMYQTTFGLSLDVTMAHPDLVQKDTDSKDNGIKQHGYHAKTINDTFLPPDLTCSAHSATPNAIKTAQKLAKLYWAWNKNNHTYESGVFAIHVRPDIRVGYELRTKQGNGQQKQYLVEKVSHQLDYANGPSFTTTIQVTRGQKLTQYAASKP
jgi:hypothetical protein